MARDVRVAILGDSRDFKRAVREASGSADGLGSKLASIGKKAALGLAAGAAGAAVIGKSLVDAALESQKVTAQTDAVIKSMGNAANVTAKQVAALSTQLSLQSGVDDELIQSGQNVLLTFGQIRNGAKKTEKNFDRATAATLDMSVALGMDMKSSAILVGKALNDPIKGLTALGRSGIQFTAEQKKVIKTLVETGKTAEAQRVILGELERQFGGSAAAQATSADKLKVAWGNIQEQLGEKLLPVFNRVAEWLAAKLPGAITAAEPYIAAFGEWIASTGAKVAEFVRDKLSQLRAWWDEHGPAITKAVTGFAESFRTWVLVPMQEVATFVVQELVPKVATFVTWIAENEGVLKAFGTLIGVTLVGHYTKLAVHATISAAKQVAAWVMAKAEAIAATAQTVASIATQIAHWVLLAAKAAIHAAAVAAAWVVTTVAGSAATAAHVAAVTTQQGGWAGLAAVAQTKSAIIARAWLGVLGPMGAAIAAAETLNNLTGQKLNPNKLGLVDRLNPFKAFKGMSFDVPFFDVGGVMPGPRGQHSLAMVAGGETVLPTHKPGFGSSGSPTNIYITTGADPQAVVEAIKRYTRSNGPLPASLVAS